MRHFGGHMINKEFLAVICADRILGCADKENLNTVFTDENVELRIFSSGEVIYSPECIKKQIGILIEGRALVEPPRSNEKVLLRMLSPSDIFGVANLYCDDQPFVSVIVAKSCCRVLFIDADAFRELIERDTNAMRAYLRFMSNRIVFLNKKISTLTAGSTEKKLAVFLSENQSGGKFSPHISMLAIAETLNVGRASLYRALDALELQGLIRRIGKTIIIPDKNALLNVE